MNYSLTSHLEGIPLTIRIFFAFFASLLFWVSRRIRLLKSRKQQLPFPDIPYTVPNPHWLLGHLPLLGHDVTEGQYKLAVQYAGSSLGISTFWTFNTPSVSILDAQQACRILKFNSTRQGNPAVTRHFSKLFGKHSLVMINGKKWRTNRDIVQRAFGHASLPELQKLILEASIRVEKAVMSTIQNQDTHELEIDALTLSRMAVLDVAGLSSLGYDFCCTKDSTLQTSDVFRQLGYMQQELTRRCYHERLSPAAQFYWLPTAANRQHARETGDLLNTLRSIIRKRRAELESGNAIHRNDLLDSVLKGSKGFNDLTDDFLSDWLITMIFGVETACVALNYLLYFLAKYPSYQSECVKDAQKALGEAPLEAKNKDMDATKDLPFVSACLWEALRYYPPTTITARNLDRSMDLEFDGKKVKLPKGTRVVFSLYWIHHSEMNFPNPDEYLPERWVQRQDDGWVERTPENDLGEGIPVGKRSNMLAFSAGARNCVGFPFALRMIPTIAAALARTFEFELSDPDYKMQLERFGGSAVPNGGIPIKIRRR